MRAILFVSLLVCSVLALRGDEKPCVFCEIVAGRAPASLICREGDVMAFLSHAPRNPGHVLVIPTAHAENLLEVPPATLDHMARLAQRLGRALRATDLRTDGLQLLMNTGKAAGQSVFHAHLHVIPRFPGEAPDGGERKILSPAELEPVAAKIRAQLDSR
jgi:diadenosine tetraphosphate (Ap4A) HIT family hydrolase